jgi:hypothetical protein
VVGGDAAQRADDSLNIAAAADRHEILPFSHNFGDPDVVLPETAARAQTGER